MTSRVFSPGSLLTALALLSLSLPACGADAGKAQYYELRVYSTKSEQQQQLVNDHWQNAAIPAYNRLGVQPIGVFTEVQAAPTNKVYVLIPFDSADAFATVPSKLAADSAFQKAAADYLQLGKANAAYVHLESSFLVAFDGMKRLAVPPAKGDRDAWVFELRTYFSASEGRGLNKIKMFNDGEIDVMKEVGLSPVFFSQMLVGSQMPCLVYMTSGENMAEHQKHWKAFSDAPGWIKLRDDPQYKDNMTGMSRILLKRTPASQLRPAGR